MEQRCTCGAVLPPDARFCHRCGKPQYQEDVERLAALEAEAKPTPTPPASIEPVTASGIGNLRAVGVTLAAAALALIGMMLFGMIFPPISPLVLCAAGFVAARIYRTKNALSPFSGVILGTMTGTWLFLVFAVCAISPMGQDMLRTLAKSHPEMSPAIENLPIVLLQLFLLLVFSSAFGGLLGARTRRPNR